MDLNLRIAGQAGQGVNTTGSLLLGSLSAMGLHVLATHSYMSRIRGGVNWQDVRVGDSELFAGRAKADLLVALTDEALSMLSGEMAPGGLALRDGPAGEGVIGLELSATARKAGGDAVMANTVAAGAVFAILGYPLDDLERYLGEAFARKGQDIVAANLQCAKAGYELGKGLARPLAAPSPAHAPKSIYSGSAALGLGAATAGVKFVAGYPMTPGTATLTWLSQNAERFGIVVEQAEDEIAAINMVCGATYAGVAGMTVTSGGGFALMTEGLSLAGMLELPAVVVLAQRPGPATGLPTRTAQQDLRMAIHAGHGEFPRAIYAPGTVEQSYELMRRAIAAAHKYQTPAIVLTDQFLQDMEKNVGPLDETPRPIDRCIVSGAGADYVRYAVTPDGVSPRAIPGGEAMVVVDSDEHTEDGHLTENIDVRQRLQDKRMAKFRGLTADAIPPELYGPDSAETLLICWGSSYGPVREAVDRLNAVGGLFAMLHFQQVWPVNVTAVSRMLGWRQRVIVVEGNQTGQFAGILRESGAIGVVEHCTRYDGMPFTAEELVQRLR